MLTLRVSADSDKIMSPDARDDPVNHVLLLHPPHHVGHLQLVVQPLLHLHAGRRTTFYTILHLQAGGEQRFTHHSQVGNNFKAHHTIYLSRFF
jgi:hypothetical protein